MINIKRNVLGILFAILIVFNFWSASKNEAIAAAVESVPGQIYILTEEEDDYDCSKKTGVSSEKGIETYGKFFVQGDIASVEKKDELPSYKVNGVTLALVYEFDKKYLEDKKGEWQLIEEDAEEINGVELQDEMGKGVIVVQRSIDGKNWRTVSEYDNVFEKNSLEEGEIYSACDLELINGCYYRVLVAYGLRKMQEEDDSFVGKIIDKNIYLYHRYVEQYDFYVYSSEIEKVAEGTEKRRIGKLVKADDFESYSGETEREIGDIHYGWELGDFFMSGFSDYKEDSEGNPIFLKTVGDKMLLSFQLKQDINKLDGNEDLYISADDDGGDQYFQIKQTDFGKGMFIIRQTDSENVQHEPMKYRDFLEAYACVTADTKVQLLEEGDYELALYYEVTKDEFIDKVGHYRIISKFSIRNGNCTMFLKDAVTNIDLPNECFAENGFYIYLANSKYLQLNVKKETLSEVEGRLVEDTRFNTVGKEGVIYDEEGIYTITVKNPTTEKEVQKKIYVGTDKRLKAYVKTGYSLEKIDKMLEEGSEIDDNGEIIPVELKETSQLAEEKQKTNVSKIDKKDKKEKKENGEKKGKDIDTIGIVVIVVAVVVLSGFLIYRKKRDKK